MLTLRIGRPLTTLALLGTTSLAWAGELTVSAAASLSDAFTEVAKRYEALHPDSKIALNFGASGALLQQMAKGAPVDVFASADQETMDQAAKKNLIESAHRKNFVGNALVAVVPTASTLSLTSLQDLAQPAIQRIAIGNPDAVPAGRYAKQALETANLWGALQPKAINTQNVRQALDYVARGEVDSGFVYATDASTLKDTVKVAFNVPLQTPILYPIAPTTAASQPEDARAFVNFVLSDEGQAILAKYGFTKP